jgi:hypothetical protein
LRKEARMTDDPDGKVDLRKRVLELEKERGRMRRSFFDAQDQIETEKEQLISDVERLLKQQTEVKLLFMVRWIVE